jgi:glyoxylase-like metal-dependent hydrolase (beta-lactamase superfamily II)
VRVTQIAPGLWRWSAPHPAWTPARGADKGWEHEVASCYCEADGELLLIDPLVPADAGERERFWRALDRDGDRVGPPRVLLTSRRHAWSSADVLGRYPGARCLVPAGERPPGLEAAGPLRPGEPLPGGAVALETDGAEEVLLWLPSHRALVAGDVLRGDGRGGLRLCLDDRPGDVSPEALRRGLRDRLRPLPVEHVLPAHGEAVTARASPALAAALQEP